MNQCPSCQLVYFCSSPSLKDFFLISKMRTCIDVSGVQRVPKPINRCCSTYPKTKTFYYQGYKILIWQYEILSNQGTSKQTPITVHIKNTPLSLCLTKNHAQIPNPLQVHLTRNHQQMMNCKHQIQLMNWNFVLIGPHFL